MAACGGTTRSDTWLCSASGERPGRDHRQLAQPALKRRHVVGFLAAFPQLLWGHSGTAAPLVVSVDASAGGRSSCSWCATQSRWDQVLRQSSRRFCCLFLRAVLCGLGTWSLLAALH